MAESMAPEIDEVIALGIRSAASVTSLVPLKTATGIPVIVPFKLSMIPVVLIDAILCNKEVLIAVALDKTPGKTDLSIPGRAEARTLGILENIEAKSVGLMLVGIAVAVIPAEDKAEWIASVGIAVMLFADNTEDNLPAEKAEAGTSVEIAVILLADKIEDKLPASMAEDKLLAIEVGIMVLLPAAADEAKEAKFDVIVPLTFEVKNEATLVGEIEPAEIALAMLEDILSALAETLANAAERDLGSMGVVAVAIIEEMLARWEEITGLLAAALFIMDCMAWTWEANAVLVAVAK